MNVTTETAETAVTTELVATPKPRAPRKVAAKTVASKVAVAAAPAKSRVRAPAAKTKAQTPAVPASTMLKEVATQGRRKVSTVVHLTRDASFKLIDTQRTIWLAGLGALAKVTTSTGAKGEKAFEALVAAGEKVEAQARSTINTNTDLLKQRIDEAARVMDQNIDLVGDAFDARVKKALARLGYPKAGKSKK